MDDILTPDDLSTDDDGAPLRYVSTFRCDDCGKDFSPEETEDLLAPYYAANPDIPGPADG